MTDSQYGRVEIGYLSNSIKVHYVDYDDYVIIKPNEIQFENRNGRYATYRPNGFSLFGSVTGSVLADLIISDSDAYFYLDGDARANNWYTNSLEELKRDIQEIPEGFASELIERMSIFAFKYKTDVQKGVYKEKIGPVIGEGYDTPPEILDPQKKGTDDHSALYLAIQAIKEQKKRIDELEEEIQRLKEVTSNGE